MLDEGPEARKACRLLSYLQRCHLGCVLRRRGRHPRRMRCLQSRELLAVCGSRLAQLRLVLCLQRSPLPPRLCGRIFQRQLCLEGGLLCRQPRCCQLRPRRCQLLLQLCTLRFVLRPQALGVDLAEKSRGSDGGETQSSVGQWGGFQLRSVILAPCRGLLCSSGDGGEALLLASAARTPLLSPTPPASPPAAAAGSACAAAPLPAAPAAPAQPDNRGQQRNNQRLFL